MEIEEQLIRIQTLSIRETTTQIIRNSVNL